MIYGHCMQQLLTFIMTVVEGGRARRYVCVCVRVGLQGVYEDEEVNR